MWGYYCAAFNNVCLVACCALYGKMATPAHLANKGRSAATVGADWSGTYLDEWHKVLLYAVVWQLLSNFAQRLHCLVPDNCLLNLGELLQRLQQCVGKVWPSYIRHKLAQLLCHSQQHFIFIIIVFHQEGQQLRASTFLSESQGNG